MDLQNILVDNYRLDYDLLLDKLHLHRMFLGKGQYIFGLHKLHLMDTLNWLHIRAGRQEDCL